MIAILLAAGVAVAQPAPPATRVEPFEKTTKAVPIPSGEDFAQMMKMFDKMFPAQPDPDPARLASARGVALLMWPDGTYGTLFETLATTIGNSVLDMKPSDFPAPEPAKGKDGKAKTVAKPKPAEPDISLREKLRREDPHFDRRIELITAAAHAELQRLSPLIEPPLREGLSRALARRFTEPQLADIGAFYGSPTGKLYARESMKMWLDGDIARSMMNTMPALIMQMPGAFERIKAASDTLPAPPKKRKATPGKKD